MKPVYWRPKKVSPTTTLTIGIMAIVMLLAVESAPRFLGGGLRDEQLQGKPARTVISISDPRVSRIRTAHGPTRCSIRRERG